MTTRNVLLTLHILSAMTLIGWLSMTGMFAIGVARQGPSGVAVLRFMNQTADRLGRLVPIVFVFGLVLVLRSGDDARYSFRQGWLAASFVLFVAAMVNGAVFINKTEKAAIAKLEAGEAAPAEASRLAMLNGVEMLILIAILWLMIAKPGYP